MPKVLSCKGFGLLEALVAVAMAAPLAAQTADLPAWIHPDPSAKSVLLDLNVTHPAGAPGAVISGEHDALGQRRLNRLT